MSERAIPQNLFVLEMANNHMGDIEHGIHVIRSFGEVCRKYPFKFAFKLQYRELDSFIHPAMKGREDVPYIKRFEETRLTRSDFDRLLNVMREEGFMTMSTPFDEKSVDMIEDQNLDIIKIASCSFGDWSLLERIAQSDRPVIASTAGAAIETIDQVVSYLQHRGKDFAIMHCVGEYPTPDELMHVGQLDYLMKRYPDVRIGFSTHEGTSNTDLIKIAMAKGATIFEKHVAVPTEQYGINKYSVTPEQIDRWLAAAQYTQMVMGESTKRLPVNEREEASLCSLRRGIFAKRDLKQGEVLTEEDIYFAFPPQEGQYSANDWSKYLEYTLKADLKQDEAVAPDNCTQKDSRAQVWDIVKQVRALLKESQVVIPGSADLEISHHYGLDRFSEYGLLLLTVVNRDYCKKILVTLPGQKHPEQYHKQKEETFHVLYGTVDLVLDDTPRKCMPGDVVTIEPGTRHAFSSETGCVIEEISSTHYKDDSYYSDELIMNNKQRKTLLTYWMEQA